MPSSDSYVRSYKQEYATAKKRGDNKNRAKRAKARREYIKKNGALSQDQVIDHVTPLKSGGSNDSNNVRVRTRSANAKDGGKIGSPKKKAAGARKGHKSKKLKGALTF